ncbi:MAG: hypothetical protein QOG87_2811 [Actinomycetota bacterium]|jgi:hypothetical protein
MANLFKMPAWRTLVGILAIVVLLGGCTRDSGDRVVADKGASKRSQELATGPEPTVAEVPVAPEEQLETAIAAGDDVVPTVKKPSAPRPARASGPAPARAPAAAKPGKAAAPPAGRSVGADGGNGPWTPGPDAANSWAVVIGIQNYQGKTKDTYGGRGDAAAFMEALRRTGWNRDHVMYLTDGAATGAAMRNAMQWLVDRSGPNTFTVFHYSGHVKQQGIGNEFLWSVDNQFIRNTDFGAVMSRLQGRAWIDIAGCEAAGFDKGISSSSRLFSAASRVNEKGYEEPNWRQSIWTGLSVDQGMLQGAADANRNGVVTVQEAVRFGESRAPAMTQGQSHGPQHPVITGGDADGWLLGRPAPPPPPPPPSGGNNPPPGGAPPTTKPPDSCVGLPLGIKC